MGAVSKNIDFKKFYIVPQYDSNIGENNLEANTLFENYYDQGDVIGSRESSTRSRSQNHSFSTSVFSLDESNINKMDISKYLGSISGGVYSTEQNNLDVIEQSGLINSIQRDESSEKTNSSVLKLQFKHKRNLSKSWLLNIDLNGTYYNNKAEENLRTDIFKQPDMTLSADSSLSQSRTKTTGRSDGSLLSSFTWTATDRLKVHYNTGFNYLNTLQDIESSVLVGEDYIKNDQLSNYQLSNRSKRPIS